MSRPAKWKTVPRSQIESFARLGCPCGEIAGYLGLSQRTIRRRFAPELARGRAQARIQLRHLQWKRAEAGSPTLLTWLGRQLLGQSAHDPRPSRTALTGAGRSAGFAPSARRVLDPSELPFPPGGNPLDLLTDLRYDPADPRVQAEFQRRQFQHIIADPAARDALLMRVAGIDQPAADSGSVATSSA